MSREDMFDGIEDTLLPEEREHYEPGMEETGDEGKLTTTLVDLCIREITRFGAVNSTLFVYDFTRHTSTAIKTVKNILEGHEYDPQRLIDNCSYWLSNAHISKHESTVSEGIGHFLDVLCQSMFEFGHNDFVIDTTQFPIPPKQIGAWLVGEHNKKLKMTVNGDLNIIGNCVRDCHITHNGSASYAGLSARYSEMHLNGSHGIVASQADRSTFYLESCSNIKGLEYPQLSYHMPTRCEFYAQRKGRPRNLNVLEHINFSFKMRELIRKQNTIYTLKKFGEWKEVKR